MNPNQAIKWSFLSEIASKAVQPLVFVILARLLTPEDYGVVASATMVISFSQVFWEAGMGKAIIQYQGDRKAAANVAFWVNVALGIVVAGILVAISGVVANRIFHDNRVAPVLQVMALQVFLSASASIHTALLQKDMNFKSLFWVRMATVAIPGLFSIPLAWYGMGYWALVAGTLAGQAMQVAMLWKMSPWKPELSFDFAIARQLIRFGGWVALSGLLVWFYVWADSLIVGIYLGPRELGLYRVGNTFAMMIFGFMFGPLLPVLYSFFSRIQSDIETLQKTLFKVISVITFISIPMASLIVINSSLIVNTIFGQKWQGIETVISILALMHGYSYVVGANGEAYRAIGKPSYETLVNLISLPVYLTAYLLSVKHGLEIFLWVRFGLAISALLFHLWLAKIIISLSIKSSFGYLLKVSFICFIPLFLSYFIYLYNIYQSQLIAPLASTVLLCGLLFISERKGLIPYILNFLARKKDYA
jgi:O-antigen/teichoic acid export membrane protein